MGSGRGNSGRILFWNTVLVGLAVLGIGIGLLVGQATVGASIGLGLILVVMVYLREGPARGCLLPWSQCIFPGAWGCTVARLGEGGESSGRCSVSSGVLHHLFVVGGLCSFGQG